MFVEARASEECGCPEEAWLVDGINLIIHIEPEGHVHAFMDGGDWGQAEIMLYGETTIDGARAAALTWATDMVSGPAQ